MIFVFSLLLVSKVIAHEGGHFHKFSDNYLNSWELTDGTIVKGNFSMLKGGLVYLEQYDGVYTKLPFEKLSDSYQRIVQIKMNRFNQINSGRNYVLNTSNTYVPEKKEVWWFVLYIFSIFLMANLFYTRPNKYSFKYARALKLSSSLLYLVVLVFACRKANNTEVDASYIPKTRASFIDSAYSPYKPAISTSYDNNYFYISAGGFPQHNMMVGITSWQQQVPIPQAYTGANSWSIPLQPVYASAPLSTRTNLMKGAVAIAVNGIPIFNALNNRGVDSYATGELDNWGGHCGRADDYHYHAAPLHLAGPNEDLPIAFSLDGFIVYGTKEQDGSAMLALDTCHGHVVGNGVYHYHGTTTYPYVIGAMRGKVTLDPSTPAPENQILPQAFASPVRPALTPLNGATITAFQSIGVNAYKLTYQRGSKFGYVEYYWDANNRYTYKLTDTSGAVTINVYQR